MAMKVPSRSNFTLEKVKITSKGNVEATWSFDKDTLSLGTEKVPHPDLRQSIEPLNAILGKIFKMTFIQDVVARDEFKATSSQKNHAKKAVETLLENVEATGISLSGSEEKRGVIITGKFNPREDGPAVAINSPRIILDGDTWGFEEELEQSVIAIEDEVYELIYRDKQAQLSVFPPDEEV